ncbi:MAG: hypothetical protein PSX80_16535 [bacterium]|nr:hypothetical protein [bacterium]
MNISLDEGQAVRVARLADVKADYQVSNYTREGVVIHPFDSSFDDAFRRMRADGSISSMNVNFRWRVGVRSGGGSVVYDGNSRFPNGTAELARRTIRSMIVRSIARDLSGSPPTV